MAHKIERYFNAGIAGGTIDRPGSIHHGRLMHRSVNTMAVRQAIEFTESNYPTVKVTGDRLQGSPLDWSVLGQLGW